MMTEALNSPDIPDGLGDALDLVRTLWDEDAGGGLPQRIVAWVMMIEAVDRLTVLHGPAAMAGMLDKLKLAVIETPGSARGTIQ